MVRGNWQQRVEKMEARRKENKEGKQKQKDKKQYKQWVQELVRFLDKLQKNQQLLERFIKKKQPPGQPEQKRVKVHLWTDSLTAGGEPNFDDDGEEDDNSKLVFDALGSVSGRRKNRSRSVGNELLDIPNNNKNKGRGRSKSMSEEAPGSTEYTTGSGWQQRGKGSKKKVHPRSSAAVDENVSNETLAHLPTVLMCRSYFFRGKCEEATGGARVGGRRGPCRYVHDESKRSKTLFHVVSDIRNNNKEAREELKPAENAVKMAMSEEMASEDPGAAEMVYYGELTLVQNENNEGSFSEQLTEALSNMQVKYVNIVYVTMEDTLIFDRFRDGLVYDDESEFWRSALHECDDVGNTHSLQSPPARKSFFGGEGEEENIEEIHRVLVRDLPGIILEQILTYLPDVSVAACSQVCKAWNHEIGKNSPHLWQKLLKRRNWPGPPEQSLRTKEEEIDHCRLRDVFLRHYTAIRDVKAMQVALKAIITKKRAPEREMAYQDFSARKHSPSFPNCCVGIQIWSQNQLIAAYAHDCSLRLFETVKKSGTDEIHCRELVCQKIDPYRNTKKRNCQIVSMGLDELYIGSLCHVMADNIEAEAYILVVMKRDDFLLGESSEAKDAHGNAADESTLSVIDVGEAVLNYLLSSDVGDHRLLQVIDFLSAGGGLGEIEVLVSQTIAACGYGRFMVEVSISLPAEDDGGVVQMHLVDRKMFLFSSGIGAIVWMGESNPISQGLRPRQEEMVISSRRRPQQEGGSRPACSVAVASGASSSIMVSEIEPAGQVHESTYIEASQIVRNEIENDGWAVPVESQRSILISSSDIIVGDTLTRAVNNTSKERKSVLSFHPRFAMNDDSAFSTVQFEGDMEIVRMACIRDDHAVLLCRKYETTSINVGVAHNENHNFNIIDEEEELEDEDGSDEDEDDAAADIAGEWFFGNEEQDEERVELPTGDNDASIHVDAIIVDVPSRCEIGRVRLLENVSSDPVEIPYLSVDCNETLGMGLSWKGIIMTGSDVRSVSSLSKVLMLEDRATPGSHKKKKKKAGKSRKSAGKKDGFARGLSLRG